MSAPKTIYLQLFDDDDVELDPLQDDEVTWCQDQINDNDVEYILASDVAQLRTDLAALQKRSEEAGDIIKEILACYDIIVPDRASAWLKQEDK